MKHKISLLFLTLVFFLSNFTFGQNSTNQIESDFIAYLNTLDNQNFKSSIEFLPEKLFKVISKNQMLDVLEQTFDNPNVRISYSDPKILSIEKPIKNKVEYYSLIEYEATLIMQFIFDLEAESEQDKSDRLKLQTENIIKMFGKEAVTFDQNTQEYRIYERKKAVAISEKSDPRWNFLVIDESSQKLLPEIIPEEVLDKM